MCNFIFLAKPSPINWSRINLNDSIHVSLFWKKIIIRVLLKICSVLYFQKKCWFHSKYFLSAYVDGAISATSSHIWACLHLWLTCVFCVIHIFCCHECHKCLVWGGVGPCLVGWGGVRLKTTPMKSGSSRCQSKHCQLVGSPFLLSYIPLLVLFGPKKCFKSLIEATWEWHFQGGQLNTFRF